MEIDFFTDLNNELEKFLTDNGLPVPDPLMLREHDTRPDESKNKIVHYDLKNLLLHVFSVKGRFVPVRRWDVHISNKLIGDPKISEIVSKLANGEGVTGFLSNGRAEEDQVKYADRLLSEWGIHHLHFKESRTKELLFVFFDSGGAYIIDILDHSKANWINTDLIQTIHDNWPELFKQYIYKSDSTPEKLTVDQRRALRDCNALTTVVVNDGTEYLPMGGGHTHSRHPTGAVIKSDMLFHDVKMLQSAVLNDVESIRSALLHVTKSPKLNLKLDENLSPFIVESNSNSLIDLKFE